MTKRARRELRTYPLRDYNNNIKRALLEWLPKSPASPPRILDVCCGRGGDIFKYTTIQPSFVYFVDISAESINEAVRRYEVGRSDVAYEAKFGIADCASDELRQLLSGQAPFDIVVCHFSLHYMFASEQRLDIFMRNITSCMAPAAFFVATFPDFQILRSLCTSTWQPYENEVMRIEPATQTSRDTEQQFGQEYFFSLEDAVFRCPEFLIPTALFHAKMTQFHIAQRLHENFLRTSLVTPPSAITIPTALTEAISLYCAYVGQFHPPPQPPQTSEEDEESCRASPTTSSSCCDHMHDSATLRTADMIVHVDADHVHFVSPELVRAYSRSVYFIFYYGSCSGGDGCGSGGDLKEEDNSETRYAPAANIVDAMILVSAARVSDVRHIVPQIIATSQLNNPTFAAAAILLPFVTTITTRADLEHHLDNEWGGQ